MQLVTMASRCVAVLVLFLIKQALGIPGEAVMFMPPLEVRTLDLTNNRNPFLTNLFPVGQRMLPMVQQSTMQQPLTQQLPMQESSMQQPTMQQLPMQQSSLQQPPIPEPTMQQPTILHHTSIHTSSPQPPAPKPHERHNMTFNELMDVINEMNDRNKGNDIVEEESFEERSASQDYGYSGPPAPPSYPSSSYPRPSYPQSSYSPSSYPQYYSHPRPYVSPKPNYGSYGPPPPAYHQPSYTPPPAVHHASKIAKSDLISSLLKPITTKVGSKVGGLIGLVLSLLGGSGSGDSDMTGFKDLIVNGIIKPLLVAKGGIKSLISKLVIPVIALLLINVEVLITVWWLWEECPQPTYSNPKPPAYNYNDSY